MKIIFVQLKKQETYEKWIIDLKTDVNRVYSEMKDLDEKQMFSKDDEVGTVFNQIKELIYSLEQIVKDE